MLSFAAVNCNIYARRWFASGIVFPLSIPTWYIPLYVFVLCPQQNSVLINITTLNILNAPIFGEYEPQQTAATWVPTFFSFPKSIYFQFVQKLGVCLHLGKLTLCFGGSFNVGIKKYVSASLTFLITLPQPNSVIHAKCCLWEAAWGTTSWSEFERKLLTLCTQTAVEEILLLTRCFAFYNRLLAFKRKTKKSSVV